jgi:hypothetical protein
MYSSLVPLFRITEELRFSKLFNRRRMVSVISMGGDEFNSMIHPEKKKNVDETKGR